MKLIHKFKSPNFNNRNSKIIEFVIIHYTALNSTADSINYLCSKKNKVSCHYLISNDGKIYNLVHENKRAWHAGKSFWREKSDINSSSIGIELDYSPYGNNNKYTIQLINSLLKLLKRIVKNYNISPINILGHSDVAPYRKIDPGKTFPWHILEDKNLINKISISKNTKILQNIIDKWFLKHSFKAKKRRILFMLSYIGYDITLALKKDFFFNMLLTAYASRYKYYSNYNYNKKNVDKIIKIHFLEMILTKLKK